MTFCTDPSKDHVSAADHLSTTNDTVVCENPVIPEIPQKLQGFITLEQWKKAFPSSVLGITFNMREYDGGMQECPIQEKTTTCMYGIFKLTTEKGLSLYMDHRLTGSNAKTEAQGRIRVAPNLEDLFPSVEVFNGNLLDKSAKVVASLVYTANWKPAEFWDFERRDLVPCPEDFEFTNTLLIDHIDTVEYFRRQGIARAMIVHILEIWSSQSLKISQYTVNARNEASKALFKGCGFIDSIGGSCDTSYNMCLSMGTAAARA